MGICNTCKHFVCVKFYYLVEGGVIRYSLEDFYNCRGCLLNKSISIDEHRFNGAQKFLLRGIVNPKQPTVYSGYKHGLNLMVSCIRSSMGTLKFLIVRGGGGR